LGGELGEARRRLPGLGALRALRPLRNILHDELVPGRDSVVPHVVRILASESRSVIAHRKAGTIGATVYIWLVGSISSVYKGSDQIRTNQ
jgi:hypothetical protein